MLCFSLALPIEQTLKELSIIANCLPTFQPTLFSHPFSIDRSPNLSTSSVVSDPEKGLPPSSSCGASWISELRLIFRGTRNPFRNWKTFEALRGERRGTFDMTYVRTVFFFLTNLYNTVYIPL